MNAQHGTHPDLFFEQFQQHLIKMRDEGATANVPQRAQVLLGQLRLFQAAVVDALSREGHGLGALALPTLLRAHSLDAMVSWLTQGQQFLPLEDLSYQKSDGGWTSLLGEVHPSPNHLEWLDKGLVAAFHRSDKHGFAIALGGQPRVLLTLPAGIEPKEPAMLFARLAARLIQPYIPPLEVLNTKMAKGSLIAEDPAFLRVLSLLEKAAAHDVTILLEGESGSGKEVLAHFVHQNSPRKSKPLVAVNCAAIPAGLMESELFGHEKGSFTGAVNRQIGKVEQANGGTLFLDEIGEMELSLQAKLLRFLQLHEFHRVGGRQKISVDVRIVAASNRNLKKCVADGLFREDLYYRLSVMPVTVPPLRERPLDILPLFHHFLKTYSKAFSMAAPPTTAAVTSALAAYSFPGNVRELENLVQNMLVLSQGRTLDLHHLPEHFQNLDRKSMATRPPLRRFRILHKKKVPGSLVSPGSPKEPNPSGPVGIPETPTNNDQLKRAKRQIQERFDRETLELEARFVDEILHASSGSVPLAAELAGINRTLLYKLLDRTQHVRVSSQETKG
jgi:DNA-binding NtrC family response regulator